MHGKPTNLEQPLKNNSKYDLIHYRHACKLTYKLLILRRVCHPSKDSVRKRLSDVTSMFLTLFFT